MNNDGDLEELVTDIYQHQIASILTPALTPLDSRGISTGNYQVLRENLQPSILIEMGYMNNDGDLEELVTDSYQQQIAASLTQALTTYFQ